MRASAAGECWIFSTIGVSSLRRSNVIEPRPFASCYSTICFTTNFGCVNSYVYLTGSLLLSATGAGEDADDVAWGGRAFGFVADGSCAKVKIAAPKIRSAAGSQRVSDIW